MNSDGGRDQPMSARRRVARRRAGAGARGAGDDRGAGGVSESVRHATACGGRRGAAARARAVRGGSTSPSTGPAAPSASFAAASSCFWIVGVAVVAAAAGRAVEDVPEARLVGVLDLRPTAGSARTCGPAGSPRRTPRGWRRWTRRPAAAAPCAPGTSRAASRSRSGSGPADRNFMSAQASFWCLEDLNIIRSEPPTNV